MLFREGLISLLQRRNIEVLAAVGDGNEGIRLAQELKPDIVLLDKRMPIIDGISVLKHLKKLGIEMPIVMLTTSSNETGPARRAQGRRQRLPAQGHGARWPGVRAARHRRRQDRGRTAADLGAGAIRQGRHDRVAQSKGPFSELTPRESEILELMAEGQGNKLIARNLGISDGTVKLHVKAVLRKLRRALARRGRGHVHRAQSPGRRQHRRLILSYNY